MIPVLEEPTETVRHVVNTVSTRQSTLDFYNFPVIFNIILVGMKNVELSTTYQI